MPKYRRLLLPLSIIYGFAIRIRHLLFNLNILKTVSFDFPVICVGNITVGGTGKTPHIEYLIEKIKEKYQIAVLSRGYKRKTKGFVMANKKSTPQTIGDEPFQIFRKYGKVPVAVCENRVDGIIKLKKQLKKIRAILLDDAFQHRYVKAGVNIVLIDYNRPVFNDLLIPAGNLRDTKSQIYRADIVIVSKTPPDITGIQKRLWIKQLKLFPYQRLFFTSVVYQNPLPVFAKKANITIEQLKKEKASILVVTGIASPKPLIDYIKNSELDVHIKTFPDHHNFSEKDLLDIRMAFDKIKSRKKLIFTTEKDAVRFKHDPGFPRSLKEKIYYLPIKVNFLYSGSEKFDKLILNYVKKNKKVGKIHS